MSGPFQRLYVLHTTRTGAELGRYESPELSTEAVQAFLGRFGRFLSEDGRHDFWVTEGKVGTPNHLAFHADDTGAVDEFYRAAMAAGGKDNGAPGQRPEYGYAAFVLDPDGHNIEAVIWDEELKRKKPRSARGRKAKAGRPRAKRRRA